MLGICLAALLAAEGAAGQDADPAAEPAQTAPQPAPTGSEASEVETVTVDGSRPPVSSQIDRQVYSVKDDPQAQAGSILDVLGKLPSVTVTPSGRVLLLGNSGVTILIDGKAPRDPTLALRALSGGDVDRIEVMTNPSAQFGPTGTAGIINIITLRRTRPGVSGAVSTSASSTGSLRVSASPSLTLGRWTVGGSFGLSRDVDEDAFTRRRELLNGLGQTTETIIEENERRLVADNVNGSAKLAFRPDDASMISLSAEASRFMAGGRSIATITSDAPGLRGYMERVDQPGHVRDHTVSLTYERAGPRAGETLTFQASTGSMAWTQERSILDVFDDPGRPDERYRAAFSFDDQDATVKLDYRRPFGEETELAVGASWERLDRTVTNSFETLAGPGSLGPDFTEVVAGERQIGSAYATLQFQWGDWTLLPGLRVEDFRHVVRAQGQTGLADTLDLYPSLHISRELGEHLKLRLSYSKRIDRPDVQVLSPAVQFTSTTEASTGNPNLKPRTTDAFEVRFDHQRDDRNVNLTLYARETYDEWSWVSDLNSDGVRITRPINAGESSNRGGEFSVRGPVGERWKYVLSANLYYRELQVLDGALLRPEGQFAYGGNGQLEYRFPQRGELTGDRVQLSISYTGPQRYVDSTSDAYFRADLTWRHALTDKTSLVVTATDLFDTADGASRIRTDAFVQYDDYDSRGTQLRVALTHTLGGAR